MFKILNLHIIGKLNSNVKFFFGLFQYIRLLYLEYLFYLNYMLNDGT